MFFAGGAHRFEVPGRGVEEEEHFLIFDQAANAAFHRSSRMKVRNRAKGTMEIRYHSPELPSNAAYARPKAHIK